MKKLLLLFALILCCEFIAGQSLRYKRFNFEWPKEPPATIQTHPAFANEDLVVLDEQSELFIKKGYSGITFVKKYIRLRFLTAEGIQKGASLVLPESFYPQADYATNNVSNLATHHEPKGDYECMEYFVARIIRPDGTIVPAVIRDSIEFERFLVNNINRTYYAFHFTVTNLSPGDDLEIQYGVRDIYDAVNTFFFHGNYPKQHCSMKISYNARFYKYYFMECNGARGLIAPVDNGEYTEQISYDFTNLPGCMNEPGSRPYKQLPYVNFYRHDLNFGIWNESRTVIEKYLPYTWEYINLNFISYEHQIPNRGGMTLDKDVLAVRNFVETTNAGLRDTSPSGKLTSIHHEITNNFNYQRDDAFIAGDDVRLPRIPEFLRKKTLRQISRNTLYHKVLDELHFEYYITFMLDKRVNEFKFDKYEGVVAKDLYFALVQDNKVNYFQPKSHRFGYFANEMPFYYEDIPVILIPQKVPYTELHSDVKKIKYVFIKTPYSSIAENTRNINVLTDISLDSLTTQFKAAIRLSGQFSTMTRGTYMSDFVDTTVSVQYGQRIFDNVSGTGKTARAEKISIDSLFPFKAEFNVSCNSKELIESLGNGRFAINMENWFNHIYDTLVTGKGRDMNFYPDFVYQDRWKYFLKFQHPVKIESSPGPVELSGDHCAYKFNVTQVQPDVIMIESAAIMKNEVVPFTEISGVEQMYKAMTSSNHGRLIVEKSTQ